MLAEIGGAEVFMDWQSILHGRRNGIGRMYFTRGRPGKASYMSLSVELVPDDYNAPSHAEVEVAVALAAMID